MDQDVELFPLYPTLATHSRMCHSPQTLSQDYRCEFGVHENRHLDQKFRYVQLLAFVT